MKTNFGLSIATLLVCVSFSPAFAEHCRDARKTCDFANICMGSNEAHTPRIQEGVSKNDGSEISGELRGCEQAGIVYKDSNGNTRKFSDVADGCTDPEYVAIGNAALQRHRGNAGACNQLHE
jgi:hypothetical protein